MRISFQIPVLGKGKPEYSVQDIRILQRNLRAIEPGLRTQFVRDIKQIGKEPQRLIKQAIPSIAPLSGMIGQGRLSWGSGKPANSTTIRFRTSAGSKSLTTTLLSVRMNSVATSIADMAGRSGRSVGAGYRGTGYTREFVRTRRDGSTYLVKRRTTREAGRAFIQNLNAATGKTASRFGWKAVEKGLPQISQNIEKVVKNYYRVVNNKKALS